MQGSRLGLNPLGEEESGVGNIFCDTLCVMLFCPPLIGPADPPAQYFLERIRRIAARISTGLHRALERIKLSSILRSSNDDPKSLSLEEG